MWENKQFGFIELLNVVYTRYLLGFYITYIILFLNLYFSICVRKIPKKTPLRKCLVKDNCKHFRFVVILVILRMKVIVI